MAKERERERERGRERERMRERERNTDKEIQKEKESVCRGASNCYCMWYCNYITCDQLHILYLHSNISLVALSIFIRLITLSWYRNTLCEHARTRTHKPEVIIHALPVFFTTVDNRHRIYPYILSQMYFHQ